jgi:hypothetical protein
MILDLLASGPISYDTGSAGTVTVPSGKSVLMITCHATTAGTLTITPKGAGQTGTAGGAIPIPAGAALTFEMLGAIGEGTVLVFSGTDSYLVTYVQPR